MSPFHFCYLKNSLSGYRILRWQFFPSAFKICGSTAFWPCLFLMRSLPWVILLFPCMWSVIFFSWCFQDFLFVFQQSVRIPTIHVSRVDFFVFILLVVHWASRICHFGGGSSGHYFFLFASFSTSVFVSLFPLSCFWNSHYTYVDITYMSKALLIIINFLLPLFFRLDLFFSIFKFVDSFLCFYFLKKIFFLYFSFF